MSQTPARVGFLACGETMPGSPTRRADAFEHDRQVAALVPALAARGIGMAVLQWDAPLEQFDGLELVLIGTSWDYQDRKDEFLARLTALEARGIAVCNPADMVRWNVTKTYLRDLAEAGAATVPTLWRTSATGTDIAEAFDLFETDAVVIKRQVGAGALGQELFRRHAPPAADWRFDRPAMIQPLLPAIQQEGEFSFVFIDGAFSHALLKQAQAGDYRIQSLFGGRETAVDPAPAELAAAQAVLAMLPFATPLYARVDMVRIEAAAMAVMEVELIEPYLYPEQGAQLGERLAAGIARRLG
jgi:hypothetical protein